MNWKTIIAELQQTARMSQAAIGAEIGRSQAWVADIVSGRYEDLKWTDGQALIALHAERVVAANAAKAA